MHSSRDSYIVQSLAYCNAGVLALFFEPDKLVAVLFFAVGGLTLYFSLARPVIQNRRQRIIFWLITLCVLLVANFFIVRYYT
jgi:hypothetical protein